MIERRTPDRFGKWLPFLLSVLIALAGVISSYAVYGERVSNNKEELDKKADKDLVEQKFNNVQIQLDNIADDVDEIQESVKRQEQTNWMILQELKARNGAHTR